MKRLELAIIDDILPNNELPKNGYFPVRGVKGKAHLPAFVIKKFRCKSIPKGNKSGFRIVFVFDRSMSLIYFVEIYHENKKENLDPKRIIEACKSLS
ncbi:MAG: hypothetical protein LBT66_08890 [Methanobrevibacter sp.]|nr:hypothetical protein [Candidatus Methanovirga meridionalis]